MGGDFSDLLRRAKAGETGALAELHARYEGLVIGVVHPRLGPQIRRRADTGDVVQSVFEDVLRDLSRFEDRGEDAFRHWISMKAENKVRDRWRRSLTPGGGVRERGFGTSAADGVASRARGPATQAGESEECDLLATALAAVSAEHRHLLTMREVEDLSYAEIAERLGLPSDAAARMRHSRALLALKRLIDSG